MRPTTTAFLVCAPLALVGPASAVIDFSNFHTPAQVNAELDNLAAAHPAIAQMTSIGNSVEGLPIRALKSSDGVGINDPNEGDVVFVSLNHAREWITVEMGLYLAEYLLTHYDTDPALRACMDNLEIWIIPVLNPDGYAYTHSVDRYWR